MNRQQKEAVVRDINELFKTSKASFLIEYKGLTVAQLGSLRRDLRNADGVLKVTKARLMKIASDNIDGMKDFSRDFKNQIGLVFTKNEVPTIAKKLVEFSKNNEALNVISAFFESKKIDKAKINFLASLPSRDVLLSQLISSAQAPILNLVNVLNMIIVRLVYVLDNVAKEKK